MAQPTPNLLLPTTYMLNPSGSKSVIAGLEWYGGLFRPVVKIIGVNIPAYAVTLDTKAWETFTHQQAAIEYYFKEDVKSRSGKPTIFNLVSVEMSLTQRYGVKAMVITQLPSQPVRDLRYEEKFNTQLPKDAARFEEPPAKKQKIANPPYITMHAVTYFGLSDLTRCIELRMLELEEDAGLANRIIDIIIDYLKEEAGKCNREEVKNYLINYNSFKRYFSSKKKKKFTT